VSEGTDKQAPDPAVDLLTRIDTAVVAPYGSAGGGEGGVAWPGDETPPDVPIVLVTTPWR